MNTRTDQDFGQNSNTALFKRIFDWLSHKANQLFNLVRHYGSWVGFLYTMAPRFISKFPLLLLRVSNYISPVARIISGLKLLYQTLSTSQGTWTRALSLLVGLGGVGLGIAAIVVPVFGVTFALANMSANLILGSWFIAVALKNKLAGPWKQERKVFKLEQQAFYSLLALDGRLEKYKQFRKKDPDALKDKDNLRLAELECAMLVSANQNIQRNADLGLKIYNTGIVLLTLAGLIMALSPATIMIGVSLLLATSIHGVLFGYDLSGKWPKKMQDYFFRPRGPDTDEELEKKAAIYKQKEISSTAETQLALMAELSTTNEGLGTLARNGTPNRRTPRPCDLVIMRNNSRHLFAQNNLINDPSGCTDKGIQGQGASNNRQTFRHMGGNTQN